jgi:hypothetical protein
VALPESPWRRWRSYGTEPLPTPAEALDMPLRAFPSWLLKVTCDRCGKVTMLNEAHTTGRRREMPIRDLLAACAMMAAADFRARRSCSPALRAPAAGRCGRSS